MKLHYTADDVRRYITLRGTAGEELRGRLAADWLSLHAALEQAEKERDKGRAVLAATLADHAPKFHDLYAQLAAERRTSQGLRAGLLLEANAVRGVAAALGYIDRSRVDAIADRLVTLSAPEPADPPKPEAVSLDLTLREVERLADATKASRREGDDVNQQECPKCGASSWRGAVFANCLYTEGYREWLEYTCTVCGYTRREPCKDARLADPPAGGEQEGT